MPKYIRDKSGNLCFVQSETPTHYQAIRVKDRVTVLVKVSEAKPVEKYEEFPGDWALGF